jgi:SAM-dependent methyltransferase
MSDWTSGYVAEIGYTYGCYGELSAERLRVAFLSAGLALPPLVTACELGYGQGLGANINATATLTRWYGTDFLPAQAAYAQELTAVAGHGAQLQDQGFAEFCLREDLPDFDFIGLHGTWSWVNDENRSVIVDFLRRKLKPGGVAYISYNTQPGWANMVPMRHLIAEHARVMGSPGQGISSRIAGALEFGEKLLELNPAYALANPEVKARFAKLRSHDRAYLAHEYFNRNWIAMPFADAAEWLVPAKLEFACSAYLRDHIDEVNFTPAQLAFLRAIPHANLKQTARDYFVDQQFRRDYWVKGARRIGLVEQMEQWRGMRPVLVVPRAEVALKMKAPVGEVELQPALYAPVLDALADQQVHSVAELEQALAPKGLGLPQILQAVRMLYAKGDLVFAQDEAVQTQVAERCHRLNAHLMKRSCNTEEGLFLASPVTGTALPMPRFHQLFLLARNAGRREPAGLAAFVLDILQANREKIVKDGRPIASAEESLAELVRQAEEFVRTRLPVLETLQVR